MMDIQYRRTDGTFVAIVNGLPYHVTPDDPLFEAAQEAGAEAPFEPVPEPPPITADQVRADRNRRLTETDWTQVADAPVDAAIWATYRQALRDVPEQAGFPTAVIWPEPPGSTAE